MGVLECAKCEFERRENLVNTPYLEYYKPEFINLFADILDNVRDDKLLQSEGELNYLITKLVRAWAMLSDTPIKDANKIVWDILNSAKKYWYEVKVIPYENKKRDENGDVL